MSLASTRVSLPHKCLIERSTQTNDGAGGIYDDWSTLTEGVSCKAWAEAPQSVVLGDRVAESEGRHVIVPPEVDINPGDRITVTDRTDAPLYGPMVVSTVLKLNNLREIICKEVV